MMRRGKCAMNVAAAELARFAIANRPIADAVVVLDTWRGVFERHAEKRGSHE